MKQTIELRNLRTRNNSPEIKYYIKTFGCQMNEYDSEKISGLLESDGMEKVEDYENADIFFINTCTIRENADNKLYGTLGELKKWKNAQSNRKLIVGGCASQKDKDLVRKKAPWVDVVLGTNNIGNLLNLIQYSNEKGPITEIKENFTDSFSDIESVHNSSTTGMLTIQIGCNNNCTFCIVPTVRGNEKSRRPLEIFDDAINLSQQGYKEIMLLGQNVNSYGRDLRINNKISPYFIELLMMINEIDGVERIRFVSPHPKDVNINLIDLIDRNKKICNHIHLPLQSGSDEVLFEMKRGYTQKKFMSKVSMINDTNNDISITSDIIVGFPGETENDFIKTLEVVENAEFDSVFMYKFSTRPGTIAETFSDRYVPTDIIDHRFNRLKELQTSISKRRLSRFVHTYQEVLIEGASKNNKNKSTGRTDNNNIVILDKIAEPGSIEKVFITKNTPFVLYGELIS